MALEQGLEAAKALDSWNRSSPAWIAGMRRGDPNREFLLDLPMLEQAGDVSGLRVLDMGCGEGRFCRMLALRGAQPFGVDPTPGLIEEARSKDSQGMYVRGVGETLPLAADSFDVVVAYLTLIDIPDYAAAICEASRVLRSGGKFLIANLNSFASTQPRAWYRNDKEEKLHVAVVDYYEERAIRLEWGEMSILNWHRPMQAYMAALLNAGLILETYLEPRPTKEAVALHPTMIDEYRVPLFHVMKWRKP